MAKKQKIKLSDEQKELLSNLRWYINNKLCWTGSNDEDFFKDVIQDGVYAVISSHDTSAWDNFDGIICTSTLESANTIEKWNPYAICKIVNLKTLWIEKETHRLRDPYFSDLIEKMDYDKDMARYVELKTQFKPILKYFK